MFGVTPLLFNVGRSPPLTCSLVPACAVNTDVRPEDTPIMGALRLMTLLPCLVTRGEVVNEMFGSLGWLVAIAWRMFAMGSELTVSDGSATVVGRVDVVLTDIV